MKTESSSARGQKIRQESGPDREKPIKGVSNDEAVKGREMGGGPTDLSHSITDGNKVKKYQ